MAFRNPIQTGVFLNGGNFGQDFNIEVEKDNVGQVSHAFMRAFNGLGDDTSIETSTRGMAADSAKILLERLSSAVAGVNKLEITRDIHLRADQSGGDLDLAAEDEVSITGGAGLSNIVLDGGVVKIRMSDFPNFFDGFQVTSNGVDRYLYAELNGAMVDIDKDGNIIIVPETVAGELTVDGQKQATVGAPGAAAAIPATPSEYLRIGNGRVIPLFAEV